MSDLAVLAVTPWETTELNPLSPSPVVVVTVLIVGVLVAVALVAAGALVGLRLASSRRTTDSARQES